MQAKLGKVILNPLNMQQAELGENCHHGRQFSLKPVFSLRWAIAVTFHSSHKHKPGFNFNWASRTSWGRIVGAGNSLSRQLSAAWDEQLVSRFNCNTNLTLTELLSDTWELSAARDEQLVSCFGPTNTDLSFNCSCLQPKMNNQTFSLRWAICVTLQSHQHQLKDSDLNS